MPDFIEGITIMAAEEFMKYAKECKICLFTCSSVMTIKTGGVEDTSLFAKKDPASFCYSI